MRTKSASCPRPSSSIFALFSRFKTWTCDPLGPLRNLSFSCFCSTAAICFGQNLTTAARPDCPSSRRRNVPLGLFRRIELQLLLTDWETLPDPRLDSSLIQIQRPFHNNCRSTSKPVLHRFINDLVAPSSLDCLTLRTSDSTQPHPSKLSLPAW